MYGNVEQTPDGEAVGGLLYLYTMRLGLFLLILTATLFGSGYWYTAFVAPCQVPVHYRIGEIDPRFGTDRDELIRIAQNAENIWEGTIKEDLFIYDENAELPVNLVFDERQQNANSEAELKEDLDVKEGMSESVSAQYETLIGEFRTLKKKYEARVISYEKKLSLYNEEVTEWNKKGGAPENVMRELTETQKELQNEQKELEALGKTLNNLTIQLNAIGARGNSLIADYNTIVDTYNKEFSEAKEFTQGDYTQDTINIYQFDSEKELTIVLAHEFGHALSLDHVDNEKSIMYHFMGAQRIQDGITTEDFNAFNQACEQKDSFLGKISRAIRSL